MIDRHRILAGWLALVITGAPAAGPAAQDISLTVCHNFGCKIKQTVSISPSEWREVSDWFATPAATPEQERRLIQQAAGWLEVVVGRHTPTHLDLGQDNLEKGHHGQMDCIDEANNVTEFLKLFEREGLMQHHRVVEQAYRRTAWDQHWAGQIAETKTGKRWVVDSWFQGYGMLPYIQDAEQWGDIPFFFSSSYIDNSPD